MEKCGVGSCCPKDLASRAQTYSTSLPCHLQQALHHLLRLSAAVWKGFLSRQELMNISLKVTDEVSFILAERLRVMPHLAAAAACPPGTRER